MRFAVSRQELELSSAQQAVGQLNASTSVDRLKQHYFEALASLGQMVVFRPEEGSGPLNELCAQDDVVLASFHDPPPEGTACRLLQHTKGALMLSGAFLDGWTFKESTMNLVTSKRQADQLKNGLGKAAPAVGSFTPRLATGTFRLPDLREREAARKKQGINDGCFHIVYAGRFISNKGIAQLVRSLQLWPMDKVRITLVGAPEPDFFIYQSNAEHATFASFLAREVIGRAGACELVTLAPMGQRELCSLFWSVDCFAYPSFHEDENFGLAPREALLCGVPAVVTDFSGLGALVSTRGGVVHTWPTLGGVRYSLRQLGQALSHLAAWTEEKRTENSRSNAEWVAAECDEGRSLQSLKTSGEQLLRLPPGVPPTGGWRSKTRVDRWAAIGPVSMREAIALAGTPIPDGLYVDGTGYPTSPWYSEPHFLAAIQGLYTTHDAPPVARTGMSYRGFWRISLWPQERAIVEWGFPGPRVKRLPTAQWEALFADHHALTHDELIIRPTRTLTVTVCQELLHLGYIVPDTY